MRSASRFVASRIVAVTLALLAAATTSGVAQTTGAVAGRVKSVAGVAQIVRQGQGMPAAVGAVLYEADALRTGADGRIGVTLQDNTRISLGPGSEVELRRFAYAPAEGRLEFVMRVVRGMAAYVSGHIAKLSPDAVRLETPMAIVGVRGTRLAIRVTAP